MNKSVNFVLKIETFRNLNDKMIFNKILVDRDEKHKQFNFNSFSKLRKHFTIFVF